MTTLSQEYAGATISDGTLNADHLIPKFYSFLRDVAPELAKKVATLNPEIFTKKGEIRAKFMRGRWRDEYDFSALDATETCGFCLEDLFDKMNEIAPKGCSFESQEGDGACFGFWTTEEAREDEELKEKTVALWEKALDIFCPYAYGFSTDGNLDDLICPSCAQKKLNEMEAWSVTDEWSFADSFDDYLTAPVFVSLEGQDEEVPEICCECNTEI